MNQIPTIKAALLGAGTVGGGVYKLVQRQKDELPYKAGANVEISRILVRNTSKHREGIPDELLTDDWKSIVNDPEIKIVIELMGGIEPARTYLLEAMRSGKQVITANKDLLAEYGDELMEAVTENHCDMLYEASVGGGIPIIHPLKQCLEGNDLTEVMGIVNGTTNYILSKMTGEGMDYAEALAQATELGYAEADPTADVEGYDAGRKIAIMASIAFHTRVKFEDVYTEGITKITAADIRYAGEFGYVIKLLGVAREQENGVEVRVHPMLIPATHPLATVNDAFNAVFVHGDAVDDAMFMGRGAGEFPTASAVMGDLIDAVRNLIQGCSGRIGCSCYKKKHIKPMEQTSSRYFLRLQVEDRSGALAGIASVFGNNGVSIYQVVQKARHDGKAELVIITENVEERRIRDALTILQGMSMVREISGMIRVYG